LKKFVKFWELNRPVSQPVAGAYIFVPKAAEARRELFSILY
jgi:hypothetical protein